MSEGAPAPQGMISQKNKFTIMLIHLWVFCFFVWASLTVWSQILLPAICGLRSRPRTLFDEYVGDAAHLDAVAVLLEGRQRHLHFGNVCEVIRFEQDHSRE